MLDTNICIYAIDARPQGLIAKLATFGVGDLVMSAITLAELRVGVERHAAKTAAAEALSRLTQRIEPVEFGPAAAEAFGRLQAFASHKRGAFDRLIAAHAISLGIPVVTNDAADFEGLPGLTVENWT
jgi:tRNA(fMet)-specific endonuclease VapC